MKTVLQMLTIIFYYFAVPIEQMLSGVSSQSALLTQTVTYVLCWLVAAVTLFSGVKYLWDNRTFINTAK